MTMTRRSQKAIWVAAIIERHDNHVLIALPKEQAEASRLWQFPRGLLRGPESPESALRRVVQEDLGIAVEIVVGQPPIECTLKGEWATIRYFFCGVSAGAPTPGPYGEIQWIPRIHLLEYEFDDASRPVAEWILDETAQ
jgi:ADP-ribose pyrophosphatase YjhB (NUDIX family)